jgi:hypothetical protein
MYRLTDNHYDILSYFIPELHEDNIYNLDKDPLIQDFNRNLTIKVLDYYIDNNLDFITKDNYKKCFEIFLHFGSEIGILFDYHTGLVKKNLDILKNIGSDKNNHREYKEYENYDIYQATEDDQYNKYIICFDNKYTIEDKDFLDKDHYDKVVDFNKKIYNDTNKMKYGKLFELYFDILQFDIKIIDYNNYDIDYLYVGDNYQDLLHNLKYYDHPNKITHIEISDNNFMETHFNKKPELFNSLTHIIYNCNKEITVNTFPDNVEHIIFSNYEFNHKIKKDVLPKSLKHIAFDMYSMFDQKIDIGVLPDSMTHIFFGSAFNQKIEKNVLPKNLKYLVFNHCSSCFNQKIEPNVLPNSIEYIELGCDFNQEIEEGVLPNSLKYLTLSCDFNRQLKPNIFPESLTHLTFGYKFNQEININVLPKSLIFLSFNFASEFNQKFKKDVLPESLVYLIFGNECNYGQKIEKDVLPESLKYIDLNHYLDKSYDSRNFISKYEYIFDPYGV